MLQAPRAIAPSDMKQRLSKERQLPDLMHRVLVDKQVPPVPVHTAKVQVQVPAVQVPRSTWYYTTANCCLQVGKTSGEIVTSNRSTTGSAV